MKPTEDRLRSSGPPAVPNGLRRRALAAAAHELERNPRRSVVDAVSTSRPLRWAWAAACAALIAGHILVAGGGSADAGRAAPPPAFEDVVIADAVAVARAAERAYDGNARREQERIRRQLAADPLLGGLGS